MIDKRSKRLRRARKIRASIRQTNTPRLSVHRTLNHIYAQIINTEGVVLAQASTAGKKFKEAHKHTGNAETAAEVGKLIAECAKKAGIAEVAFDRSGFKYHGRIKSLADAARKAGLKF